MYRKKLIAPPEGVELAAPLSVRPISRAGSLETGGIHLRWYSKSAYFQPKVGVLKEYSWRGYPK
jgi:hypothetical protein